MVWRREGVDARVPAYAGMAVLAYLHCKAAWGARVNPAGFIPPCRA